jgi:hypothetical protein
MATFIHKVVQCKEEELESLLNKWGSKHYSVSHIVPLKNGEYLCVFVTQ